MDGARAHSGEDVDAPLRQLLRERRQLPPDRGEVLVLPGVEVGYLPQDPRSGDPEMAALDRILSARGLDDVVYIAADRLATLRG